MKISVLAVAVAAGLFAAGSAHAQSYKATRDFSYLNPGGVWSYGYGMAGAKDTFVLMKPLIDRCGGDKDGSDCFRDGDGLVGSNVTGKVRVETLPSSSIVFPSDALHLHTRADGQDVIVQFKAPAAGNYQIEGHYQILDSAPNGVAPRIFVNSRDVTKKAFGVQADLVLTGAADPAKKKGGERKRFSFTRALAKGDRVQFGLNPAGDFRFDSTAFDVVVTPVAAP